MQLGAHSVLQTLSNVVAIQAVRVPLAALVFNCFLVGGRSDNCFRDAGFLKTRKKQRESE